MIYEFCGADNAQMLLVVEGQVPRFVSNLEMCTKYICGPVDEQMHHTDFVHKLRDKLGNRNEFLLEYTMEYRTSNWTMGLRPPELLFAKGSGLAV